MHQFRFHVRSLIGIIVLIAIVLTLRDRLNRRWYSCAGRTAHHTQRARAFEARFREAKSRGEDELAGRYLRVAWWHHDAAERYREAAFWFYLPYPKLPVDGPMVDERIELEAEYIPAQQRTRPGTATPDDNQAALDGAGR